jgi:hypothetical protein
MAESINTIHPSYYSMTTRKPADERYGRDLPLEKVFYVPAASRILDFFILNQNLVYSESDISRLTEVSARTLQRVLPILIKEKLLTRDRKEGLAFKYELNLESERTRALLAYFKATVRENMQNPDFLLSRPRNDGKKLVTA